MCAMFKSVSAAALAALVLGGAALAADWTFQVPLRLVSLHPELNPVAVECFVSKVAPPGQAASSANVLGRNRVSVTLPAGGSLSSTVSVPVTASAGKNPAEAVYYKCSLMGTLPVSTCANTTSTYFQEKCRTKPGAAFVPEVAGSIPR